MDELEPLLSTAQLARNLGVATTTVAGWRTAGTGPKFIRIGTKVKYRPRDVRAWLDLQAKMTAQTR